MAPTTAWKSRTISGYGCGPATVPIDVEGAPNDPNASRGAVTLIDHSEPEPGGFDNVKQTVRWDIRKNRLR